MLWELNADRCKRRYLHAKCHFPLLHLQVSVTDTSLENIRITTADVESDKCTRREKRVGQDRTKEERICAGVFVVFSSSPFLGGLAPASHIARNMSACWNLSMWGLVCARHNGDIHEQMGIGAQQDTFACLCCCWHYSPCQTSPDVAQI